MNLQTDTGLGIVGSGFVADYYMESLKNYPQLKVRGVFDKDKERSQKFSQHYSVPNCRSLEELLQNQGISIVLNLTNPKSHYAISKQALEAGKHVYSEKPFAMEMEQAKELVRIAGQKGLLISSAPCSLLGESAQTLWNALRNNKIGTPLVAYAELDDGPIYKMEPEKWKSASGTPWPAKDEYEVGCTLEHAGYYLTWLAAFFGPARSVTAFSACLVADKKLPLDNPTTPDFSVACIQFDSGMIARLTCGIVAPHDHSLKIVGEDGILSVDECWHYGNPVKFRPFSKLAFKAEQYRIIRESKILRYLFGLQPKTLPFITKPNQAYRYKRHYMDFARGVAEMASAIQEKRMCRLSPEFCLHINELALAIQGSKTPYQMTTSFEPIE